MNEQIELLLGLLTFTASSYLGILVFLKNRQSWTNRLFGLLALFIDVYIVVNFLSLHPPLATPENQLFWIRVVMFITSIIGPFVLLLVHTFPGDKITLKKRYLVPLFGLMITSATFSLLPLVFSSIHYPEGELIPIPGPGMPVFFVDFVGMFILSFVIIIVKYIKAIGENKARLRALLIGVLFSFSLMATTTVIFVVILKTSSTVFLGPIVPVILMAAIAYAIVKHRLFNMKVVATQAFTAVISIILFSKIFVSQSSTGRIIDIFIFIATLVFGILLIRSVLKEVQQREQLEKLSQALYDANAQLKKFDQAKTEFLSITSHQLRTPLSGIKGYVSMLVDGDFGKFTKEQGGVLNRVRAEVDRLIRLVQVFLNVSRIESGRFKMDKTKFNLTELIDTVIAELTPVAQSKKLKLNYENGKKIMIMADQDKLKDVVVNLVDNAIKYTQKGSVVLEVKKQGNQVTLSVNDTGVGINPQEIDELFKKFKRAKGIAQVSVSGSGLGLFIAKKIIEAHGGTIWAESKGKNKGSTFAFTLPIK